MSEAPNITKILQKWSEGDPDSLDELVPLVYQELHRLAHRALARNAPGNTVQTTALVHEAYLRLMDVKQVNWQDRVHFFAVSATLMRNILVDFARHRMSQKRGGALTQVDLDEALDFSPNRGVDLVALDEVLKELSRLNERQGKIVELKFFGGLTEEEISEVLKISPATIRRDWQVARAWLYHQLAK
jgi:RNA polymerase sigma factor (TIGR02999 family)